MLDRWQRTIGDPRTGGGLSGFGLRMVGGLVGLEGRIVEVEADIGAGLPCTVLVGLPTQPSTRRVIGAKRQSASPSRSGRSRC